MSNEFKFQVLGVEQATGAMRAAILAGEKNGMEKIGLRGVQLVQRHTPVGATQNLIEGVFSEMKQSGLQLAETINIHGPAARYANPVEFGAKAHMPPVEPIVLWVQKKLHVTDEKQALSLAWRIAQTIKKRGMKGAKMFEQAYEQLKQEAQGIMEKEIAEAIQAAGLAGKN